MVIGVSLRFALAVGLHLRNTDPSSSQSKKESLVQTWWSLHAIEILLCTLIGRPCVIPKDQCTVPLPSVLSRKPSKNSESAQVRDLDYQNNQDNPPTTDTTLSWIDTDTATRASYLGARVTISLIIQKTLSKLYSPQTSVDSWQQIQKQIESLSTELDRWEAAALPVGLGPAISSQDSSVQRERLLLSFQYHSAKLLIYRPCLCRLERHIIGQSDASVDFNQKAAEACIQAAQAMTRLLPDQPDLAFVYQQSPWWCIVHNIMQAIAVYLLEMFFSQSQMAYPDGSILASTMKLVRWLQTISSSNAVARRAFNIVIDIIETGAPQLRTDISEILAKQEARQDHNFQANQWLRSVDLPSYPGDTFPRTDRHISSSNNPAATAAFGTQYPNTLWEQQQPQGFQGFQSYQYPMLESDSQVPSMFGNPFFTNFDLSNPLEGLFSQG